MTSTNELTTNERDILAMLTRVKLGVRNMAAVMLIEDLAEQLAFSFCESPCLTDAGFRMALENDNLMGSDARKVQSGWRVR